MMTNLLLFTEYVGSPGWDAVDRITNNLFQTLIPIGICVVLPIIIVAMIAKNRKHEVDRKTEVLIKAIENGAQLDPAFFESAARSGCKQKTVKNKLMGYLITACITSGIGLVAGIVTIVATSYSSKPGPAIIFFVLPCAILLAVGIAFFIVYFIGKNKTWAKELAELDAEKPSAE